MLEITKASEGNLQENEVVRFIPVVPVSVDALREQLEWNQDISRVPFATVIGIQKDATAQNPHTFMFAGGRRERNETEAETALREFSEELHGFGLQPHEVRTIADRQYEFDYHEFDNTISRRRNKETFTIGLVPSDVHLLHIYTRDKIKQIVAVDSVSLEEFFNNGWIGKSGERISLIENLLLLSQRDDASTVKVANKTVSQIRSAIMSEVGKIEWRLRALLVNELYENIQDHAAVDRFVMDAFDGFQDETILLNNFSNLLGDYRDNAGIERIVSCWKNVLNKMQLRHFASLPHYQASALAARRDPFSEFNLESYQQDELGPGEKQRYRIALDFMEFIKKALTFGSSTEQPKTIEEIQERVQKIHSFFVHVHNNGEDLIAFKNHVSRLYQEKFGVADITNANQSYNDSVDALQKLHAVSMGAKDTTPGEVAQIQQVKTGDIAQLLLMNFGCDPTYDECDFHIHGKLAYEARRKLLHMAFRERAYQFHTDHIRNFVLQPYIAAIHALHTDKIPVEVKQFGVDAMSIHETALFVSTGGDWYVDADEAEDVVTDTDEHTFFRVQLGETLRDKTLDSYIRKLMERGLIEEEVRDIFGYTLVVDSERTYITDELGNNTQGHHQWQNAASRAVKAYFAKEVKNQNDDYSEDELKDRLNSNDRTGGSQASNAGLRWIKWYASVSQMRNDFTFGNLVAEMAVFPSFTAFLDKLLDDPRYAQERLITPDSGLYPVMQLWFNPALYSDAYADIASLMERNGKR